MQTLNKYNIIINYYQPAGSTAGPAATKPVPWSSVTTVPPGAAESTALPSGPTSKVLLPGPWRTFIVGMILALDKQLSKTMPNNGNWNKVNNFLSRNISN